MNPLILSVFLFFISNISSPNKSTSSEAHYFEGTVTYTGGFIRKTDKYDSTTLALLAGNETILFFREGNYLAEMDNSITTRLLYRKDENKIYRERFNSDSVYWTPCDEPGQKILKFTKNKNVEKILDIDCDELKIIYENRTTSYYYNADTLKINPVWSKNSISMNEDFIAREMKSISLKIVIEYHDFILTATAVKIVAKKIDNSIFDIPNKPLAKYN